MMHRLKRDGHPSQFSQEIFLATKLTFGVMIIHKPLLRPRYIHKKSLFVVIHEQRKSLVQNNSTPIETPVLISKKLGQSIFPSFCWVEFFTNKIVRHRQKQVVISCYQVRSISVRTTQPSSQSFVRVTMSGLEMSWWIQILFYWSKLTAELRERPIPIIT